MLTGDDTIPQLPRVHPVRLVGVTYVTEPPHGTQLCVRGSHSVESSVGVLGAESCRVFERLLNHGHPLGRDGLVDLGFGQRGLLADLRYTVLEDIGHLRERTRVEIRDTACEHLGRATFLLAERLGEELTGQCA